MTKLEQGSTPRWSLSVGRPWITSQDWTSGLILGHQHSQGLLLWGWGDEAGRAEAEERAGRCHFISHNLAKPVQGHSCYSKFIKGILDTSLFLWFCVLLCFILFLSKVPFENSQICLRFMSYYLSWVILLLVIDSRDQLDQGTWRLEVVVGGNNNTTSCCITCSIFLSHLTLIIVWNKHYCSCVRKEETNLRFREIQSPINVK